nr:TPA_asm: hypothetical protein HUJ06_029541 [Nelumbo nucifera]
MGMVSSPESSTESPDGPSQIFPSIYSYDGKVMLAAIVSLLVVVFFVLLLHAYTRWLLGQAHQRRGRSISISQVFGPARLHHVRAFAYDDTHTGCSADGLDSSVIASLPIFIYKSDHDENKNELECIVCLSVFEDDETGRSLPKCQHAFHVECIDMWLQSHSSCPICRAPVGPDKLIGVTPLSSASAMLPSEEGGEPVDTTSGVSAAFEGTSPSDASIEIQVDTTSAPKISSSSPPQPSSPSSLASSSSLGCSLKRMLSRNRSERKVFPSSNANELNV